MIPSIGLSTIFINDHIVLPPPRVMARNNPKKNVIARCDILAIIKATNPAQNPFFMLFKFKTLLASLQQTSPY